MKNLLFIFLLIFLQLQSFEKIKVTCEYDKKVDFRNYKTYKFSTDALNFKMEEINRNQMPQVIHDHLNLKGIQDSEEADALVNFYIAAHRKELSTAYIKYYEVGERYDCRWGASFYTTTIDVENYIAGSVFIDLVEAGKNSMVWQGRGAGTLNENISPEKREKCIMKGIAKIFKN